MRVLIYYNDCDDYQRTVVYLTVYGDCVVFLDQVHDSVKDTWTTRSSALVPCIVIQNVQRVLDSASDPDLPPTLAQITSIGVPCAVESIDNLDLEVRKTMFDYESQLVPLTENQEGTFSMLNNLRSMWNLENEEDATVSNGKIATTASDDEDQDQFLDAIKNQYKRLTGKDKIVVKQGKRIKMF